MKCFFDFRVKGSRLLAICLGYLICLWAVFGVVMWSSSAYTMNRMMMTAGMPMAGFAANNAPLVSLGVQLIYFVVSIFLGFFLITECVKGLSFKGYSLQPHYDLGKYVGQVVTGFLLTLITIGIYYPWFITKITRFFASGTTYRDQPFAFNGKGATLFFFHDLCALPPLYILVGNILFFAVCGHEERQCRVCHYLTTLSGRYFTAVRSLLCVCISLDDRFHLRQLSDRAENIDPSDHAVYVHSDCPLHPDCWAVCPDHRCDDLPIYRRKYAFGC